MNRASRSLTVVAALVVFFFTNAAYAQSYPTKPIRMIVTLGPGSSVDLLARTLGDRLGRQLGQPIIVENRAGAGGRVAADAVAKAAPDGYTLMGNSIASHAINPALYGTLSYDPVRDFAPITLLASSPNVLVIGNAIPALSVVELIAHLRKQGDFAYSSGGQGTSMHLAGEMFASMIGVKGVHVPFKSSPEAITAVVKGDVVLMFPNAPNAIGLAKGSKLRALATTTAKPISWWSELPTMADAGLAGFDVTAWFGLAAPAGTPEPIVRRLNAEVLQALAEPTVRDALVKQGFEVLTSTPEEFGRFVQVELAKWTRVIKAAGLKPE
jgi:tripartite-type tricarboxylate transporter receptor subunit TctC